VVVNQEPVGQDLGIRYDNHYSENGNSRDFFSQGSCDGVFLELAAELGWLDDLYAKKDELPPTSAKILEDRMALIADMGVS
jgi:hypothetical protein